MRNATRAILPTQQRLRFAGIAAALPLALLFACSQPRAPHWLGYVEGDMALIAPPQSGWISSLNVTRGAQIKVGDALFTLDAVRELAARDSARAAVAAAREQSRQSGAQIEQAKAQQAQVAADIERSAKELERMRALVASGSSARRELEVAQAAAGSDRARRAQAVALQAQAVAAQRQGEAQISAAEAALRTAEFNLAQRTVSALVAGEVQDIYFRSGEYAAAGTPAVALLSPDNVFVRFFVPETALASLHIGGMVRISCDGCAADLRATVSFIAAQSEFTPPIIYSIGNRERLVYKAEARLPAGLPARPGLPVEVWQDEPVSAAAR